MSPLAGNLEKSGEEVAELYRGRGGAAKRFVNLTLTAQMREETKRKPLPGMDAAGLIRHNLPGDAP